MSPRLLHEVDLRRLGGVGVQLRLYLTGSPYSCPGISHYLLARGARVCKFSNSPAFGRSLGSDKECLIEVAQQGQGFD